MPSRRGLVAPKPSGVGGFTLIEIMIVVSVVVLLSLLAMVAIGRIQDRAARSLIENNLRQLYQAKEYYYSETGSTQVASVPVLARSGYLSGSVKERLMNTHSFEANKGWHYYPVLRAGQPVLAYQGEKMAGGVPTGEVIYYPGPPSSLTDLYGPGIAASATAATANNQPVVVPPPQPDPVVNPPPLPGTAGPTTQSPAIRPPVTTSAGGPGNSDFGHAQGNGQGNGNGNGHGKP
ncbi:MAG: prepilin-type N-terminal cleavage/methylation domain-containing protein [Opitutae bacterium]